MKKIIASLLTLSLLTPALALAHPGDWGSGGWGRHGRSGPYSGGSGQGRFLPAAATAVPLG